MYVHISLNRPAQDSFGELHVEISSLGLQETVRRIFAAYIESGKNSDIVSQIA